MEWEILKRKSVGRFAAYGSTWDRDPCMSVGQTGITLNSAALKAFGIHFNSLVVVCVSETHNVRKVGLKLPTTEDEQLLGYTATRNSKTSVSAHLNCKAVAERFPDCVGRAFRLHLNPGERVIEADLSPDNSIGTKRAACWTSGRSE